MEWYDYVNWGVVISSALFGWLAGWNYGKQRTCRHCLGRLLFVVWKLHRSGTWFSAHDLSVIELAIGYMERTK